jgi:hypothetical protein
LNRDPIRRRNGRGRAIKPDEVLYRARNAPERFEETDPYFAHKDLPEQSLPSRDLLSAVHLYMANFYERSQPGNQRMQKFMNETALIALGILIEESAREELGETGDIVFTEAAEIEEERHEEQEVKDEQPDVEIRNWKRSQSRALVEEKYLFDIPEYEDESPSDVSSMSLMGWD